MLKIVDKKKSILLKNTIMLYILQFSNYLLSLIVVPYETRVLNDMFGKLGVAAAIMLYFQLFIDFGFMLSATEDASRHRDDKKYLSQLFTSVTISKLVLSLCSVAVLLLLSIGIPKWQADTQFYLLFLIATIINSLIPDYLYRGIEKMSAITVRTVIIKFFFTVMIFIFLKRPEDYHVVPILNIIGNSAALIGVYIHLYKHIGVKFASFSFVHVKKVMSKASVFFISRIASTAYTAGNTIILDLMSSGMTTSLYTAADKLVTTAKNGMSPISDSLYPYMTKHRDFKLVKKALCFAMPIIICGCAVVFIFARPLCLLFFGPEYGDAAPVLRAMLPVVVVILPSYILGFPMLSAMGLAKHANYSVIFGSVLHIVFLVILYFSGHMNMITLAAMVSITETSILLYRIIVIYRNRDILKQQGQEEDTPLTPEVVS